MVLQINKNNISVHFCPVQSKEAHLFHFWPIQSLRSISVYKVYFSLIQSFQSTSVHLVYFCLFSPFRSKYVHFSPFSPFQSTLVHSIHFFPFGPFWSKSVDSAPLIPTVHFGPCGALLSIWFISNNSIHFGPFGPFLSTLVHLVYLRMFFIHFFLYIYKKDWIGREYVNLMQLHVNFYSWILIKPLFLPPSFSQSNTIEAAQVRITVKSAKFSLKVKTVLSSV